MNPKIARCTTIAAALTIGWLAGMASMSMSKADAPRFAELTPAQLDNQQRPIADRILKFSRIGIGGPYHIMLRSPEGCRAGHQPDGLSAFPVRRAEPAQGILNHNSGPAVAQPGGMGGPITSRRLKAGVSEETLAQLKTNMRPTSDAARRSSGL